MSNVSGLVLSASLLISRHCLRALSEAGHRKSNGMSGSLPYAFLLTWNSRWAKTMLIWVCLLIPGLCLRLRAELWAWVACTEAPALVQAAPV